MIYKGKVISTHLQDPTNLVRVAVPQVSGTKTQTARVGISDVIEPGDQVWVGYEAGDFSAPVVLGKVGEPPEGPEGPAGPEGLPASRNLLHNGAMQVHQRSTSVAGITTANWHTADRWYLLPSSMGTWTNTVESDAPTGSGFRKSYKVLCTTADASPAAGDYVIVRQRLEGQDVQALKKGTAESRSVTLSFWTKSNSTGTHIVELYDNDNARHVSAAYTVASSGTWEYQSLTFPGDVTGAFDNDSEASLAVQFWLGAGTTFTSGTLGTTWGTTTANRAVGQTNLAAATSNYWQSTGAQLEVGTTATEYQFKSYGQELRECQRYYQKFWSDSALSGNGMYLGSGQIYTGSSAYFQVPLLQTMRTVPSVSYAGTVQAAHYSYTGAAVTGLTMYGGSTPEVVTLQAANSGTAWTASTGWCCLKVGPSASPGTTYVAFSADL